MDKKKKLVLSLDLGALLALLLLGPLAGLMLRHFPPCPFAAWGIDCPACGGTRCVGYLFSGHIVDAFWAHPYFFVSIAFLGVLLVLLDLSVLAGVRWARKALDVLAKPRTAIIWAVGLVLFTFARAVL